MEMLLRRSTWGFCWLLLLGACRVAHAQQSTPVDDIPTLPETEVVAEPPAVTPGPSATAGQNATFFNANSFDAFTSPDRRQTTLGTTQSASQGTFGRADLEYRPFARPAEVMELVPGLIATQHSGSGKANQYFLRGFNLDHGTDFAVNVDGVPINLRTHGHGQGYLDLNFLIPELIDHVDFRKGPYYAQDGDFASAGAADISLSQGFPQSYVKLGGGSYDFWRALVVDSSEFRQGTLLTAFEFQAYDGPWVLPENVQKYNGVMKYTVGDDEFGGAVSLLGYSNRWTATDQIPRRAVEAGLISRLGFIDGTDGGRTARVGVNTQLWSRDADSETTLNLYSTYYDLDLWSNFTYLLDNPVDGDQFQQSDRRFTSGLNLQHAYEANLARNTIGGQVRNDAIPEVALLTTTARVPNGVTSDSKVYETSYSLFAMQELTIWEKVRPSYGLRGDIFHFDVTSRSTPINSGTDTAGILSPKASIAFGPWAKTEIFTNWGLGFHSNDARGVVIQVDPADGVTPVGQARPLVRSHGCELGVRTQAIEGLTSTVSVWNLDLDSELLFVGDAGTTEASRPSRRTGVEWTNFYTVNSWLQWDVDAAFTHARFRDDAPEGDHIPGAIGTVLNTGPTILLPSGFFWTFRTRYFGPRPLVEDNSIRSNYTSLCNMAVGYQTRRFRASVDFLNLFNSKDHDIDYFYTSRLPGEPAGGVDDLHYHPVEPFGVRFNLAWMY
jgi:hypothetical protein